MSKKKQYTDDQIIAAVKNSFSIRQVLIALNLVPIGGSYKTIHRAIKRLQLDITHFTGMLWSKGKKLPSKIKVEEYLVNGLETQSHRLRLRLLKDKIFEHKCSSCLLEKWLNGPIPLELDHIDGNHINNELSNLRLLCPNCHSLTSTYRGKNKRNKKLLLESGGPSRT